MDSQPLRVIIAEDSALIRAVLARLIIDSGGVVVAGAVRANRDGE